MAVMVLWIVVRCVSLVCMDGVVLLIRTDIDRVHPSSDCGNVLFVHFAPL